MFVRPQVFLDAGKTCLMKDLLNQEMASGSFSVIVSIIRSSSGVFTLAGEADLEACAGFLVGGTGACPLMCGAGSCPSGGQSYVKGCV